VSHNRLSGNIPESFTGLEYLEVLCVTSINYNSICPLISCDSDLSNNAFEGIIPLHLVDVFAIHSLCVTKLYLVSVNLFRDYFRNLASNQFRGEIPNILFESLLSLTDMQVDVPLLIIQI